MYFQCDPGEDVDDWSRRPHLGRAAGARVGANGYLLKQGRSPTKAVLPLPQLRLPSRCAISRLLLAGDAAHTVPPTGAKGLNMALADVRLLAEVLERAVPHAGRRCAGRVRPRGRSPASGGQHFSYWMTTMLHALPGATDFDLRRQLGELESVATSLAGPTYLAEAYTGWPSR